MRWGATAVALLILSGAFTGGGCGTARPRRTESEASLEPAPLPEEGAVFDARVRVRGTFAEEPVETLRARMQLWVTRRARGSATLRARVHLLESDRSERGYDDVDVTIDRNGNVVGMPRSLCTSPAFDELQSTRLVWAVLGTGPSERAPGERVAGAIRTEIDEASGDALFAVRHRGEQLLASGSAELELLGAAIGGVHYRGPVLATVRQRLSARALLPRRTSVRIHGAVTASGTRGGGRGYLDVESDSEIAISDARSRPAAACATEAAPEGPDPERAFHRQRVIDAVEAHRRLVTACYERELARAPTLAGRVRVELTILTSGRVANVHVVEDTIGVEALGQCLIDVVEGFSFEPGPRDGSLTYAFPFVFSPADVRR